MILTLLVFKVAICPFDHEMSARLNVYSKLLPCTQKLADLDWTPVGTIVSRGPQSVYQPVHHMMSRPTQTKCHREPASPKGTSPMLARPGTLDHERKRR